MIWVLITSLVIINFVIISSSDVNRDLFGAVQRTLEFSWVSLSGMFVMLSTTTFSHIIESFFTSTESNASPFSLIFILLLWISFPLVFMFLKGLPIWKKIPYVWVFSTHLSLPLYFVFLKTTEPETPLYI